MTKPYTRPAGLTYRSASFEIVNVKADGATGLVEGYAAMFGNEDQGDDVIEAGAFKRTLAERGSEVVYCPSHDWSAYAADVPAVPVEIREDSRGLFTASQFLLDTAKGKDAYTVIAAYQERDRPFGMSIGYMPIEFDIEINTEEETWIRRLKDCELFEYGHVLVPMNRAARTTNVKGLRLLDDADTAAESLNAIAAFIGRVKSIRDLRAAEGKRISDDALTKVRDLAAAVREQLVDLEAVTAGELPPTVTTFDAAKADRTLRLHKIHLAELEAMEA